ncbi:Transposon Ty3-I Gag-Pol polyprotein [Nymphaea thermarum]|nr:Transposon Ty3-I Gag-Pol polyprotein [Nymphaea thermarum]
MLKGNAASFVLLLSAEPTAETPTQLAQQGRISPSRLSALLTAFKKVFELPKGLPQQHRSDHRIPLQKGAEVVNRRPYKYSHQQREALEKLVQEMLTEGNIQPSNSPFTSLALLVKKKDGSWRFCIDYNYRAFGSMKDFRPRTTYHSSLPLSLPSPRDGVGRGPTLLLWGIKYP